MSAENPHTPDEPDAVLRHIEEVINTMRTGPHPQDALLRGIAADLVEGLPTREHPITGDLNGDNTGQLAEAIGILGQTILTAKIHTAVADGYVLPPPRPNVIPDRQEVGLPSEFRTGRAVSERVANDPKLASFDREVQALIAAVSRDSYDDLNARARLMNRRRELSRLAMVNVLQAFGVPPQNMRNAPRHSTQQIILNYCGNRVALSTLNGVTDIVAWNERLSQEEGTQLWEDQDQMTKEGATIAHLNHYLQNDGIPRHLAHLARQITDDGSTIEGAFNEHSQQVRAHALSGGLRTFQVHSPDLRLALPVALHLLEHPPEETYDIIGDYSATNGFIETNAPGSFHRARRPGGGWVVGEDGVIRPSAE